MSYKGEALATQLRDARQRSGLSQRALSAVSGLTQSHISQIERGALEPGLASLIDIARALDLELVLVPRSRLPAVEAIIGDTSGAARRIPALGETQAEIARGERLIKKQRALYGGSADLDKIQETLRFLHTMPLSPNDRDVVRETLQTFHRSQSSAQSRDIVKAAAQRLQALRNRLAHGVQDGPRPAYSLDEDDDA